MTIVKQGPVDLYKFNVKNQTDEGIIERVILSQIKKLLLETNHNYKEINTIFLNKVIYYSTKQIFDEKNPNLLLSGGWYKYGPCYEGGRVGEGTRLFLAPLEPSKIVTDEVEAVFKEEFPLFISAVEKDDQFFHSYLRHIYEEKQEYPDLKEFYLAKNDLCFNAYNLAYGKEHITTKQFRKNMVDFEKAILDKGYANFVKVDAETVDTSMRLISLIGETLIRCSEDRQSIKNEFLDTQTRNMAFMFDKFVQMPFVDKNYIATFKTANERFRKDKKEEMKTQFKKHMIFIENRLTETLELLEPYKILLM